MFHISLARLRALSICLLLASSSSLARLDTLFTSSVTYCNPPENLLIQRLDIAYLPHNRSVTFNVSAASVIPDIEVNASLLVNVYGLNPFNTTINLCGILSGALCPLPIHNFLGWDNIVLPKSVDIASKIPGIAYKIPDLEGFAQLILTDVNTREVRACVQTTLSNGWSMRQPAAEWTSAAIVLAMLLATVWRSAFSKVLSPYLLLELLALYQTIAASAFLDLNYPSAYRSFALNFGWAVGLIPVSPNSAMQQAINRMRGLTGGKLTNSGSGSAVDFVNRKYSPYNVHALSSRSLLLPRGEVQTVTATSDNILEAGVPIYVNSLNIPTANAFMTVFLVTLIYLAVVIGIMLTIFAAMCGYRFYKTRLWEPRAMAKSSSFYLARPWFACTCLITIFPLFTFIFYQWTLSDSWLSILLSVVSFLAVTSYVAYLTRTMIFATRRLRLEAADSTTTSITSDTDIRALSPARSRWYNTLFYGRNGHISSDSSIEKLFRLPLHSRWFHFSLITIFAFVIKAIIIAAGKNNGGAQVTLVLAVDVLVLGLHAVIRPYTTTRGQVFAIYLASVKVICTALTIAFVERFSVPAITRVIIGLIISLVFSITIIVIFINFVLGFIPRRKVVEDRHTKAASTA